MDLKGSISATLINQKECFTNQLKQLYDLSELYQKHTGVNPITGQKTIVLQTLSNREVDHVLKSAGNSKVYPLTCFENELLQCIDDSQRRITTTEGAERLLQLMQSTKTIGERFMLLECVGDIRDHSILEFCYLNGLLNVLLRYMEENHDIVTNYDYIVSLLTLLATIPLPSRKVSLESAQLSFFMHCGDPEIEDVAKKVTTHWSLSLVFIKQYTSRIKYFEWMSLCVKNLLRKINNLLIFEKEIQILQGLSK